MNRQYSPFQRYRLDNGRKVGTIPTGTILYIQDWRPMGGQRDVVCREPWIIEAWLPRHHAPTNTYLANGGHLAVVRSLRTGRRQTCADWLLLMAYDAGLTK